MQKIKLLAIGLAFVCYLPSVQATETALVISSPKEGAKLSAQAKIKVTFKALPGPNADHLHLYVDDADAIMLHKLKGSHTVGPLTVGKHGICIRLVNKEHVESEVQDCVMFRVEDKAEVAQIKSQ